MTKDDGTFRFKDVVEGTWSLEFESNSGDDRWRGKLENIEVLAGGSTDSLRIYLVAAMVVKGTVDLSVLKEKPRWGWRMTARVRRATTGQASAMTGTARLYPTIWKWVVTALSCTRRARSRPNMSAACCMCRLRGSPE
ncbi:MAG TPA: hypothetical protein EYP98_07150 [Planctomycetes bacterium]|nr:hypothetical protein [Planctomycetota bacterium]